MSDIAPPLAVERGVDRGRPSPAALSVVAAASLAASIVVPLPGLLLDLFIAASVVGALSLLADAARRGRVVEASKLVDRITVATLVRLVAVVAIGRAAIAGRAPASLLSAIEHAVAIGGPASAIALAAMLAIVHLAAVVPAIERLAEVTARFSLDGLPGAQLAIDADVRSGSLSALDAKPARRAATARAQSLGALDGAIKLARGEAIAALTVAFVAGVATALRSPNGLGGGIAHAARTTSAIAAVGLLPALLSAGAIAILLPRAALADVDSESRRSSWTTWKMAMAGVAALAAVLPGVPALPMVAVAIALVVADTLDERRRRAAAIDDRDVAEAPTLWSIAVGAGVAARLVESEPVHAALQAHLRTLRSEAIRRTGLPIAEPIVERTTALAPNAIEARFRGVCVASVVGEDADAFARMALAVQASLAVRAVDLVTGATIDRALERLHRTDGAIVRAYVPRPITTPILLDVVRGLVVEGVAVADLAAVLEAVGRRAVDTKDIALLVEAARAGLRRSITQSLVGASNTLAVVRLDAALEDVVRGAVHRAASSSKLALGPSARREIVACLRVACRYDAAPKERVHVVLASSDVRRFVREIVGGALPALAVVAPEELDADLALTIVAVAAMT